MAPPTVGRTEVVFFSIPKLATPCPSKHVSPSSCCHTPLVFAEWVRWPQGIGPPPHIWPVMCPRKGG